MSVEPLVRRSALILLLLATACGSERDSRARPTAGCTPNKSVACVCAPGVQGVQVCLANATFEPCQCADFDGGAPRDAQVGMDAGPAADTGPSPDTGPTTDTGVVQDAGPPEDSGLHPDANMPDTGPRDSGVHPDAAPIDTGVVPDAGFLDTGVHPDAQIPDSGVHPDASVPDSGAVTDAGTVACTQDSQCSSGRCHPLYGQCVPSNRKLHCETCSNDSECGMDADHCLTVTIGGTPAETICAQGCSRDNQCPRGYECSLSNHCYPIPGAIRVHTCAALEDTLNQTTCDPFLTVDQCGLSSFDDATCVLGLGCSVGCVSNVQCPSGTSCTNWFVGDFCTVGPP